MRVLYGLPALRGSPAHRTFFRGYALICCAEFDNLNLAKWIYIFKYYLLTIQQIY
jgi:hypothetical protein